MLDVTEGGQVQVRVFGAGWCEDTARTRRLLRRFRVPHVYRDVDLDLDALREATALHEGPRRTPIVEVDGHVLAEPRNAELLARLVASGALAGSTALARMKDHNVGDLDRLLRVVLAVTATAAALRRPPAVRWPVLAGAAVLAFTAARAWCPVYDAWQVTSVDGPGDRPGEAERDTWLASTTAPLAWSK